MSKVFISYRRDDSMDVVGRIYDWLAYQFGSENLFMDVDDIPLGIDFRKHLADAVGRCKVLLAVIGRQWLTVTDGAGRRRIDDPRDFVRIEVESALQRGIAVIPVLVQNATMPTETALPDSLKEFAFRNGISVRPDPDFRRDLERLIASLEEVVVDEDEDEDSDGDEDEEEDLGEEA